MPRVLFLGVASAYPRATSDPTSLLIEDDPAPAGIGGAILVDSGGSILTRLLAAGRDPARLEALFITHTHPDHLGGFPLLVQGLRMLGRRDALVVAGHDLALAAAQELLRALGLDGEQDFPIRWLRVPRDRPAEVTAGAFELRTFPSRHSRPTLGVRVVVNGRALVYSSDTGPGGSVAVEGRGAAVLIHEMGALDEGGHPFHSTPADLARMAAAALPERLLIVHAPPLTWEEKTRVLALVRGGYPGLAEFAEAGSSCEF